MLQHDQEWPIDIFFTPCWTANIVKFLQIGQCLQGLSKTKWRYFRLQSIPYVLIDVVLFKKFVNIILLRCIKIDEVERVLHEFHDGNTWEHFSLRQTKLKIMRVGYNFPNLFNDYHTWVKKFNQCSIFIGKESDECIVWLINIISSDQKYSSWYDLFVYGDVLCSHVLVGWCIFLYYYLWKPFIIWPPTNYF